MAEEFFVPKLGQTMEQVILVRWLVEDGSKVDVGQEVMEVETDKAIFSVEANAKGYIHLGPFKEGQVLPVLSVVAVIGTPEDRFEIRGTDPTPSLPVSAPAVVADTTTIPSFPPPLVEGNTRSFASPRARDLAARKNINLSDIRPTGGGGVRVVERDVLASIAEIPKASPVAQRLAAAAGVDLRHVTGTGPGGRIVKEDITRFPADRASTTKLQPEVIESIPLKGIRAIIAERMAASVHTTAHVTLVTEVDATEFVATRMRIKAKVEQEWGFAPGYNDMLARIVVIALRRFPYMNARLATDSIEILGHINLGMAVDTVRGLLVPVIRDADQKSLRQFGVEFRALSEQARSGHSLPDDLVGGTFTITNLGMYDIDAFTPVINLPQAAILGVGRIAAKVVVYHNEPSIRQMLTLSLVFDHRLTDGAPAARFLQNIKQLIEDPTLMLAE